MKILITGICGFVGSTLARSLKESYPELSLVGIDNLSRSGSWLNWDDLKQRGVRLLHGDIRMPSDLDSVGPVDWVIDTAANPSVLAGIDGKASTRQLLEHNLGGTINLLEFCKANRAGFTLLSTSRVYGIEPLSRIRVIEKHGAFVPDPEQSWVVGASSAGIAENFSVQPPISLYGASKLASETLALEYGAGFGFPVWINRCGVLAGAGQFGRADQGIFAFWINAWLRKQPLKYIGFGGNGYQVRDCLHPCDLVPVLAKQFSCSDTSIPRVCNFSGGKENAMSLAQLSQWCEDRFGGHTVESDTKPRPFDIPWMVLDHSLATKTWNWKPRESILSVCEEIARHAQANPSWLQISG